MALFLRAGLIGFGLADMGEGGSLLNLRLIENFFYRLLPDFLYMKVLCLEKERSMLFLVLAA